MDLVNPSLLFIIEEPFSSVVHQEAYKIYADEGFHAAMCVVLRESVGGTAVAVPDSSRYRSEPMQNLLRLLDDNGSRKQKLRTFFAAAINETLITQSLVQAKDPCLKPSIRELISYHAMDEAQHHRYFSYMIDVVWASLSDEDRGDISSVLPHMLMLLLEVDSAAIREDLSGLGISSGRAESIAKQIREGISVTDRIRKEGRGSLHAMKKAGMLDYSLVKKSFSHCGLDSLISGAGE
jgi:hypothetical protein